jgi:hypothetical protein
VRQAGFTTCMCRDVRSEKHKIRNLLISHGVITYFVVLNKN